jgi:hypothetical protein
MQRYFPLASLVAGTTAGGLLTGVGLALGWYALAAFDAGRPAIVLGVGGIAAVAVVRPALRRWLPEAACQVRSEHLAEAMHRAAFRWGVELGTGVRTFVVTPALYAVLAISLAQGEPWLAAAVSGIYGCTRGAAIAWFATVHARREPSDGAGVPGVGLEPAMRLPLLVAIAAAVGTAVS